MRVDPTPDRPDSVIPNFCRARALVPVIFAMQLVATILALADLESPDILGVRFVMMSLYLQWLGISCAGLLCALRPMLMRLPPRVLFLACWAVLLVVTLVVATVAWKVAHWSSLPMIAAAQDRFVLSNLFISTLISPLLLRYFWAQNQWREQVRAEGEARYQALHARIRPHFLFNALNSVAALIATKPAEAEELVVDLSDLFRVSLGQHQRLAPLEDEIEIVRTFLRIEQVRLGDKLRVEWAVPDELLGIPVPPLSVQPLVENAVVHGVASCKNGGVVRIAARRLDADLVIEVDNPLPPGNAAPVTSGSGTAVRNIAQRLALVYGDRASVDLGPAGENFRATLRMPTVRGILEEH